MCRKIDARIHDRERDGHVKFSKAPIEEHRADRDDYVVIGMAGRKRRPGTRALFRSGKAHDRSMKNRQEHRTRFDQLEHASRLHLLRSWATDGILERLDDKIGKTERHQGAKDKGTSPEPVENAQGQARRDEEWDPNIRATNHGHEQVEDRIRPSFVNQMKNPFVHLPGRRRRSEDRSRRPAKQAAVLLAAFALLLLPARGQNYPDAQQVLAQVRLQQSAQQIDLQGQLRQDAQVVPFHLVQEGPIVRYLFSNPEETLQLKLGANDARLEEISRRGTEKVTGNRLDDKVRGTAITFEDLALKFLYWPNARIVGADFIRTRNCWKMQLTAPPNDSQYGSITLWVDKDSGALMRMEGFARTGKLMRRFEVVSAQKIENRWYLKQMRVEAVDPASGRTVARTYLEILK